MLCAQCCADVAAGVSGLTGIFFPPLSKRCLQLVIPAETVSDPLLIDYQYTPLLVLADRFIEPYPSAKLESLE